MKATLRHLDVYRALMTHRSISRAAEALNLTQPAITKTLGALEDRLGLKLFDRGRHGCTPTAEGEQLFQFVDNLFDIYSGFERVAEDLRSLRAGHLRVVANPALSLGLLARIVGAFKTRHPQPSLVLRTVPARLIPEVVGTHQVDIGLVLFPTSNETTRCELLGHGRFHCVLPADHRLADRSEVSPADMAAEDYVSFTPRMTYGRLLAAAFEEAGCTHAPAIEVESSATACAVARELDMPAIVDDFVLIDHPSGALAAVPLAGAATIPIGICFPRLRPVSGLAAAFLDIAREETRAFANGAGQDGDSSITFRAENRT